MVLFFKELSVLDGFSEEMAENQKGDKDLHLY
jgi:hypothetical protein